MKLEGEALVKYVRESMEREERRLEREQKQKENEKQKQHEKELEELKLEQMKLQEREKEATRKHELEMQKLRVEELQRTSPASSSGASDHAPRTPKLPAFKDGSDDLDSYLQRFERFATNQKWDQTEWATYLSALLSGAALDVYSRLSDTAAVDYDQLKQALLKRYNLTEEGYRVKFRTTRPQTDESPSQLVVRLRNYLSKWIELSKIPDTTKDLKNLLVKEQFVRACPKELATHLGEQDSSLSVDELTNIAERYLKAHRMSFQDKKTNGVHKTGAADNQVSQDTMKCYTCHEPGHKSSNCPRGPKVKCVRCGANGHEAKVCKTNLARRQNKSTTVAVADLKDKDTVNSHHDEVQVACATTMALQNNKQDGYLLLYDGSRVPLIQGGSAKTESRMTLVKGVVNGMEADTLRDTGCTGVLVKKRFVKPDQYNGESGYIELLDRTLLQAPYAKITIQTPYYNGEVTGLCLEDMICDLIIGNIPGAKERNDPDIIAAGVTTRAQANRTQFAKPLNVAMLNDLRLTREDLKKMQEEDKDVTALASKTDPIYKGDREFKFEKKDGILHRIVIETESQKITKQLVVPKCLRTRVMEQAHNAITGGHQGIRRTTDKVLSAFYWPGLQMDVTRFCRSCAICQKTIDKGSDRKVPLQPMPLIDQPFKRVAVDLIGPIHPPSEKGHRYILTLIDYATRYPEATPLKNIDTDTVAEALVDIYTRVGVPEEVLSDLGTQFVSDCMTEVSRLLSIKQLTTTPYHPMCNGLVERFNGTLKKMLKRLCAEQPKQWHRYINALLFAYREVPQESTKFSPFELLYGRTVRGPMQILKALWTKEIDEPEVRTSYEYVFELREKLEDMMQMAQDNLGNAQARQKHYYDKKTRRKDLKVGDKVLLLRPTDNNKLLMQWKGPYVIEETIGLNDYVIRIDNKRKICHANLLKKFVEAEAKDRGKTSQPGTITAAAGICLKDMTCAAVIEDTEACDTDEELLELGSFGKQEETWRDVHLPETLNDAQKEDLTKLIQKFQQIFTDQPGCTNVIQHHIKLTSNQPVRSKPYKVPFALRQSLREDIANMLKMKVIRRSQSPYASPVVVVKKPDGTNRVCIDFRKINKISVVDPEPMAPIQDVLEKIGDSKYFSTIDLSKGYWQVPVADEDIQKTAFVTPDGAYECLRMPFGMVNAGATLVRGMRKILEGMDNISSYVDDVIVYTNTWEEHIERLRELFTRLHANGFTVRPTKCNLGAETTEFVGHSLSAGKKTPKDNNITKILKVSQPSTKTEIRSFLGMTGFYRDYIPNYAAIAAPLTDMTKKGKPNKVVWTEPAIKAYEELKLLLTKKPILQLPDQTRPYVLRTDASECGIGAVLLQEHEGMLFPVMYASRKLSTAEKKYCTMEKECLAIVWAVKKFNIYLYGKEFTLQTDHQPLIYLNRAKYENGRIMRWALFLQMYQFVVQSIRGKENCAADFFSRVHDEQE